MVVTEADAAVERAPRTAVAATYRERIIEALKRFRAERSPAALVRALIGRRSSPSRWLPS